MKELTRFKSALRAASNYYSFAELERSEDFKLLVGCTDFDIIGEIQKGIPLAVVNNDLVRAVLNAFGELFTLNGTGVRKLESDMVIEGEILTQLNLAKNLNSGYNIFTS